MSAHVAALLSLSVSARAKGTGTGAAMRKRPPKKRINKLFTGGGKHARLGSAVIKMSEVVHSSRALLLSCNCLSCCCARARNLSWSFLCVFFSYVHLTLEYLFLFLTHSTHSLMQSALVQEKEVGAEDDFLASVLAETGEGDDDDGGLNTDALRSRKKKRKGGLMAAVLHGTMDEARQAYVVPSHCSLQLVGF